MDQGLDHIQVSVLSSQRQRAETVGAAGVRLCSSLQEQLHEAQEPQTSGLVEGGPAVVSLLVDMAARA